MSFILKFYEELDTLTGEVAMKVDSIPTKIGRFEIEYQIISKLGEGSFGEAFKVRNRNDGRLYAVKKSKEQYLGYKDRE
jgi:serine/threonine protein kinase